MNIWRRVLNIAALPFRLLYAIRYFIVPVAGVFTASFLLQQLWLSKTNFDMFGALPDLHEREHYWGFRLPELYMRPRLFDERASWNFVAQMYPYYLKRPPDEPTRSGWATAYTNGMTPDDARVVFLSSEDYYQHWRDKGQFAYLESVFRTELHEDFERWKPDFLPLMPDIRKEDARRPYLRSVVSSNRRRCIWAAAEYFYLTSKEIDETRLVAFVREMQAGASELDIRMQIMMSWPYYFSTRMIAESLGISALPDYFTITKMRREAEDRVAASGLCFRYLNRDQFGPRYYGIGSVRAHERYPRLRPIQLTEGGPVLTEENADFVLPTAGLSPGAVASAVDQSGRGYYRHWPAGPKQYRTAPASSLVPGDISSCDPNESCYHIFFTNLSGQGPGYLLINRERGDIWKYPTEGGWNPYAQLVLGGVFPDSRFRQVLLGDVNGDNLSDLIAVDTDGQVFVVDLQEPQPQRRSWGKVPAGMAVFVMRLNADEKLDLLAVDRGRREVSALYSLGNRFAETAAKPQIVGGPLSAAYFASESLVVADSSGDGVDELIGNGPDGKRLLVGSFPSESPAVIEGKADILRGVSMKKLVAFNLNGDPQMDLLGLDPVSRRTVAAVLEPDGHFTVYFIDDPWPRLQWLAVYQRDRDGDGDSDIVMLDADGRWFHGVSDGYSGMPHVKVTCDESTSANTNSEGYFSFNNLTPGQHVFTPILLGFEFDPPRAIIDVGAPDTKLRFIHESRAPVDDLTQVAGRHHPVPCYGYQVMNQSFIPAPNCSNNEAVLASEERSGDSIFSNCCRLPSNDILTQEFIYTEIECPPDYVDTGAMNTERCLSCFAPMRCTKINTERYQLGELKQSRYYGLGVSSFGYTDVLNLSEIPASIRYSAGRIAHKNWHSDGCIGNPIGSLFVKKTGGDCPKQFTRELQYRGLPGDPPRGTPVKMLPDCADISNIFSPKGECVPPSDGAVEPPKGADSSAAPAKP